MKGETMDEIKIFYFNNGMVIIGKPEYKTMGDSIATLAKTLNRIIAPRAIMVVMDETGRQKTQLIELYGKPDVIDIHEAPLFVGEMKDKEMWKTYVTFTTTLHLAS